MFRDSSQDEDFKPSPSKTRKKCSSASGSSDEEDVNESCQITVDNSQNILKVLNDLFTNQNMCDVHIKVDGKVYGAHRFILSASSDVFQAMLMNSEWKEWHESHIELQEVPICQQYFQTFLEYFYTGKIMITHTNVMPILALADKYLVKSLSRTCNTYMCRHVPHAAYHNQLSSWLQYSTACGHSRLFDTCQNFLKWNFETVAITSDYNNFDADTFLKILQQDDVVVHNEMMLFNYVVMWMELQKSQKEKTGDFDPELYKHLIEKLMKYIRFPMMTPRQLADLLISPIIRQHKEYFVDRMAIGMKYHSGYKDQIEPYYTSPDSHYLFRPRLYTSDNYSAVLTIENFFSLQHFHVSTFVFSSHLSPAEHESHKISEWEVDFYPKGVYFKKCYLIFWHGTIEVPEEILKTVRLSLTCRESPDQNMRVKISVLIYGMQGNIEHVMQVREKIHHFTPQDRIINIDDLLPYADLNPSALEERNHLTPFLVGPNRDQLKLNLVIAPIK